MQLHGPAKSLQLAKMSYENKARITLGSVSAVVFVLFFLFGGGQRLFKDLFGFSKVFVQVSGFLQGFLQDIGQEVARVLEGDSLWGWKWCCHVLFFSTPFGKDDLKHFWKGFKPPASLDSLQISDDILNKNLWFYLPLCS